VYDQLAKALEKFELDQYVQYFDDVGIHSAKELKALLDDDVFEEVYVNMKLVQSKQSGKLRDELVLQAERVHTDTTSASDMLCTQRESIALQPIGVAQPDVIRKGGGT
jgi:hypothetical protein